VIICDICFSYIARGYAKTILGYINDMHEAPAGSPLAVDPSLPVYIVEVGAGHGKLGYLVIEALLRLREYLPTHKRYDSLADAVISCERLADCFLE
jgi:hypothetical protein